MPYVIMKKGKEMFLTESSEVNPSPYYTWQLDFARIFSWEVDANKIITESEKLVEVTIALKESVNISPPSNWGSPEAGKSSNSASVPHNRKHLKRAPARV